MKLLTGFKQIGDWRSESEVSVQFSVQREVENRFPLFKRPASEEPDEGRDQDGLVPIAGTPEEGDEALGGFQR